VLRSTQWFSGCTATCAGSYAGAANPADQIMTRHPILDPAVGREQASQLFTEPWLAAGRDLASSSADLLQRCLAPRDDNFREYMICGGMYRHALVAWDGLLVCMEQGAVDAAWAFVRQACDASFGIDFMLTRPDYWARMYFVASVRQERLAIRRMSPGTPEYVEYDGILASVGGVGDTAARVSGHVGFEEARRMADATLSAAEWKDVNDVFERASVKGKGTKQRRVEPVWYEPGPHGVASMYHMAQRIGRRMEYETIYRTASAALHGTSPRQHWYVAPDGKMSVEPVRRLGQFFEPWVLGLRLHMHTTSAIMTAFRPGELPAFREAYVSRWRAAVINQPKITVNRQFVGD
jgi:hypothetical protein